MTPQNRAQRRAKHKLRGVGWTRQLSSKRARSKKGTPCLGDAHHRTLYAMKLMRLLAKQAKEAEAANNVQIAEGEPPTFEEAKELLAPDEEVDFSESFGGSYNLPDEYEHVPEPDEIVESILAKSVKEIEAELGKGDMSPGFLKLLSETETAGKNRKGVHAAIAKYVS